MITFPRLMTHRDLEAMFLVVGCDRLRELKRHNYEGYVGEEAKAYQVDREYEFFDLPVPLAWKRGTPGALTNELQRQLEHLHVQTNKSRPSFVVGALTIFPLWHQKRIKTESTKHFCKSYRGLFGMLKDAVLAHIGFVVMCFGPWRIPKCPKMGHFWTKNGSKRGEKTIFAKAIGDSLGCPNKCV